jgi:hypothetical protein
MAADSGVGIRGDNLLILMTSNSSTAVDLGHRSPVIVAFRGSELEQGGDSVGRRDGSARAAHSDGGERDW